MEEKYYLTYNRIHAMAAGLAERITADGFVPDIMVAIGTGGFIPARMLKTFLKVPIITVGIAYYDAHDKPMDTPRILQWIDNPERFITGKRVLVVDEVDDSRATLAFCTKRLLTHNPAELAVTVLHNKRKEKKGVFPERLNRYFAAEELDDIWICYPWDAFDIGEHDKHAKSL